MYELGSYFISEQIISILRGLNSKQDLFNFKSFNKFYEVF